MKYSYLLLPMQNKNTIEIYVTYVILLKRFRTISLFTIMLKRLTLSQFLDGVARIYPTHEVEKLHHFTKMVQYCTIWQHCSKTPMR